MEKGSSEIAKLTERISKDPKSKLFVPLAEEYKKAGDIEMAIAVLTEGLKNNPGYVTAKSFLGRLLLEKGNLSEAQKEFEEVIKAIPDNVLAQRKLGNIHVLQGKAQEALLFYKAVLAVNPKDPELSALVADIEAGRDVREKIAGAKQRPAAGLVAPAVPTPEQSLPAAAPRPPAKLSAASAAPPRPQPAPVGIQPSVNSEEPEEVLVFESLDEAAPAGALLQPASTQDMFADLASETGSEEAVRMDDGLTGGEGRHPFDSGLSEEPQPVSGRDAGSDRSAAVTEHEFGSTDAGLSDTSFFDSVPMQTEPRKTVDALGFDHEPDRDAPVGEPTETASADDMSSEALFFDVEPVETEAEPGFPEDREAGQEPMSVTLDINAPGPVVGGDVEAAPSGETLPEADDFTTDTLAELYIAQGFYEKAVEIYERMLADRPNSRLLKDKLANVRAMGSASSADEEQGTPVLFEAPEPPPIPSPQPVSADGPGLWKTPGVEAEAKEYIPPPADDFGNTAFDSGFAPVEYVLPEAPGTEPPSSVGQELPVRDEEPLPVSPKTAPSKKERAIVKLDDWLKNIMKEK